MSGTEGVNNQKEPWYSGLEFGFWYTPLIESQGLGTLDTEGIRIGASATIPLLPFGTRKDSKRIDFFRTGIRGGYISENWGHIRESGGRDGIIEQWVSDREEGIRVGLPIEFMRFYYHVTKSGEIFGSVADGLLGLIATDTSGTEGILGFEMFGVGYLHAMSGIGAIGLSVNGPGWDFMLSDNLSSSRMLTVSVFFQR